MNYLILIIVAIAGIALGMYIARRKANAGFIEKPLDCARDKQMEHPTSQGYEGQRKTENKQKILAFVQERGKVRTMMWRNWREYQTQPQSGISTN